ncbi:MAG: division/cell wall cluster transcriptional repressor MraZ, partial [Bacteroidales bacterium]|nr:division/cell wall cluster transcriptional repressor MraZ [Bacteroidales bacterium]
GKMWRIVGGFNLSLHHDMAEDQFLIGSYECKIDAKGRVLLPSGLKKQLLSCLNDDFLIKRSVFQNCLELFPKVNWDKEIRGVDKLNRFVKKNNDFIRSYTAGVKIVELDSQDRFLISKDLIDYAGLKKNLVLTSVINKIEIWDKDQYEQALKKIDDFGALAEEVMGNIQPE